MNTKRDVLFAVVLSLCIHGSAAALIAAQYEATSTPLAPVTLTLTLAPESVPEPQPLPAEPEVEVPEPEPQQDPPPPEPKPEPPPPAKKKVPAPKKVVTKPDPVPTQTRRESKDLAAAAATAKRRKQQAAQAKAQARYEDVVARMLAEKKRYPRTARRRHNEGEGTLSITIHRSGNLIEAVVKKTSGHEILDREMVKMTARAAPFPPFPSFMNARDITIVVPIRFELR